MGKNNRGKQQHRSSKPQPAPAAPSPTSAEAVAPAVASVAVEQVAELAELEVVVAELAVDPPPEEPLPPGLTVAQALKNAWDVKRTLAAAQKRAEDLQTDAKEARKRAEEAEARAEKQLAEAERRGRELDARESALLDREGAMLLREQNAEAGFLVERRRMVADLEASIAALHAERASLETTIAKARAEEGEKWRAEIEARTAEWSRKEAVRSARWAAEEDEHAAALAKEREAFDRERRAGAAAQREEQRAERDALEEQRRALTEEQAKLRAERIALRSDQEMLAEDRKAIEKAAERKNRARVEELEADLCAEQERSARLAAERSAMAARLADFEALERRFHGQSPEQILERMRDLERRLVEAQTAQRAGLGEEAARRLAELEKERAAWLEERRALQDEVDEAKARAGRQRIAAVELEAMRDEREALRASNKLLSSALTNLRQEVDKLTKADDKRNPMESLLALDVDPKLQEPILTGSMGSLKAFADDLRHRIARSLPGRTLYYTERDVRCFLGGMAMSRLALLQGISGTGKTSLPKAFAAAVQGGHVLVEVQAGWRDRQDLIGYYNAFHRHYYATNFLQALYTAGTPAYRDRPFLIILDEINLSRVEQFFADFLSALEVPESERRLTLLSDPAEGAPALMKGGMHLPIPPNVWFVGTANHDETTTEFADKTYDRAHVMELPRRDPRTEFPIQNMPRSPEPISYQALVKAFAEARKGRSAEVEAARRWLAQEDGIAPLLADRFRVAWGNRIDRDIENFVPVIVEAGGSVGEALDHILATKVLRKLRDRHYVSAKGLDDLEEKLLACWSDNLGDAPDRCLALIKCERRAKREADA